MKLFCKECGCEFQPEVITDRELCPNTAGKRENNIWPKFPDSEDGLPF